ncbi:hypothetical protein ACP4OV_008400 [Aristida adscensionis]
MAPADDAPSPSSSSSSTAQSHQSLSWILPSLDRAVDESQGAAPARVVAPNLDAGLVMRPRANPSRGRITHLHRRAVQVRAIERLCLDAAAPFSAGRDDVCGR